MRCEITIDADNAAFSGDGERGGWERATAEEVARILLDYSDGLTVGRHLAGNETQLRDSNGNTVGRAVWTD